MKRNLYCTFIILFFATASFGQQVELKVNLLNKNNEATARLLSGDSNLIATQALRNSISFNVTPNSNYILQVTATGMEPFARSIAVGDSSIVVNIDLKSNAASLGNVTIVSRRPLITQDDDKTIVDAEVLAQSSTNAYEVLEKVPGAVVDQDGNVYLNSATPAQIQINGRDMKLSTADLASLLKSLPANSILKIEVLRSPSAKFDASGGGGIVNIVLKKGVKLGTNGSANIGYFQGKYSTFSAGTNINRNRGKTNTYLSYQFTSRKNFESLSSLRFINRDNSVIDQIAFTTYPGINNYIGAGIDIAVNDKFSFGYDARISINNNRSEALNDISVYQFTPGGSGNNSKSLITSRNASLYLGNNISSKYKIDSLGSEITASIDYNKFSSGNNQEYTNDFIFPVKPKVQGDGRIDNDKNVFIAMTDLTLKLKKAFTVESGFKITSSSSRNASVYFIDSSFGRQTDVSQTNKFRYKETITAAYVQVAKTFHGFTIKPGLRLETTDINGRQLYPADTSLHLKRTDLFPYVYLRRKLFSMMGFTLNGNLIYRRSISRPYYEILNPYSKYIDPYLRDIGNPSLRPQFTTNYEFNVMADDIPVISIGINDTKDIFTNVTYQDSVTKIAYRTFDNLGENKETYYRVLGGIPPGGKYFFYVGAQYNHTHYKGAYNSRSFEYKRGSWLFFMYQSFKPSQTLTLSMQGFMRLKGLQNFYEIKSLGALTLTVNKAIMNKKANIILSVNDILRTNKYDFSIEQAGIKAVGSRYNDTRRVGLTFRYNFGIKPREENQGGFSVPQENATPVN